MPRKNASSPSASTGNLGLSVKPIPEESIPTADLRHHEVASANILVVGPTGTGKSTFVRNLRNPTAEISVATVDSDPASAQLGQHLFELGGAYYMLQIIDTPGFGESGGARRTDFELEETILRFVRKGITNLHMVLVVLRFGMRYTGPEVDTIMNVLEFLGSTMRANTSLLFTHSEGSTPADRKDWVRCFRASEATKLIWKYCAGGPYFTGVCKDSKEVDKAVFRSKIKEVHVKIIHSAVSANPIPLYNDKGSEAVMMANKFQIMESAAKDSLTLKRLSDTLLPLVVKLDELRTKCSKEHPTELLEPILIPLADITPESVRNFQVELGKLQGSLETYDKLGKQLAENAQQLRELHHRLSSGVYDLVKYSRKQSLGLDEDDGSSDDDGKEY